MNKRIVIAVISDLVTDQRVHKVSLSLHQAGYDVLLLGAKRRNSLPLAERPYKTKRIHLLFGRGPLFYAEWNLRLFFKLLFLRADAVTANDLDTLPAAYLAARMKRSVILYDTHEYFTEMQELQGRNRVKRIWQWIEKRFFPRVKYIYTVNRSIAGIYENLYKKEIAVVRNLPLRAQAVKEPAPATESGILLCQGAGLHFNRGLEELVLSLNYLPENFTVVLAGNGLAIPHLQQLVAEQQLEKRVRFTGLLPMQELANITQTAFLGFSLDKPTSLNQLYSLPNKLFDYMAAGKPVIAGNLPEIKQILETHNAGLVLSEITPAAIAEAVMTIYRDKSRYVQLCINAQTAARTLCWENEQWTLLDLYKRALRKG